MGVPKNGWIMGGLHWMVPNRWMVYGKSVYKWMIYGTSPVFFFGFLDVFLFGPILTHFCWVSVRNFIFLGIHE